MSILFNRFLYFILEEIIIKMWYNKELKLLFSLMGVWVSKSICKEIFKKKTKNSNLVYKVYKGFIKIQAHKDTDFKEEKKPRR